MVRFSLCGLFSAGAEVVPLQFWLWERKVYSVQKSPPGPVGVLAGVPRLKLLSIEQTHAWVTGRHASDERAMTSDFLIK